MAKGKAADVAEDTATQAPAQIETKRVEDLALDAKLLPEQLEGDRLHPVKINRNTWRLRVAMVTKGWTSDSLVSQAEFDQAIAAAGGSTAR